MEQEPILLPQIVQILPEWGALKPADIKATRLVGITNNILKVTHNKHGIKPGMLIFRVFGSESENPYLNRDIETHIFEEIAKAGIGPKIYGHTKEIRLEEYLPSTSLPSNKMQDHDIIEMVAYKLRQFHGVEVSFLPKESIFDKLVRHENPFEKSYAKMKKEGLFTEEELKILEELKGWLNKEQLKWLSEHLKALDQKLVLSHNDLLANNILIKTDFDMEFIDYEYTCYNYRAFDIANYFIESMIDYEVSEPPYFTVIPGLPNMNKILRFVQVYALSLKLKLGELDHLSVSDDYVTEYVKSHELTQEVDRIMKDIPLCMMLSNLFWGSWAVGVSKNPLINFDYIKFAQYRMRLYKQIKQKYFTNKE